MKILYLVTKSERGGAQVHVLDLVRTLRGRIEPVVACGDDGFLIDECRKLGVEVHIVPDLVHPIRPLQDARAVVAVSSLIRRCCPDIVHGHTSKAGLVARLAGSLTRTPALYTVHAWSFVGTAGRAKLMVTGLERAMRFAGGTVIEVCRSNFAMARRLGVVNPARHLTIWNGMPDTPSRACRIADSHRPIRLLMAARFAVQKDHASLLYALAGIDASWQLTLAGEGPQKVEMEQLSRQLGLQDRVIFTGDTDQVESLLASSDIFVLSSMHESLPLSIIEAMRAGLPVIATDVGGVSELVTEGVTGYLVPRSDVGLLTERLRRLITSPETRSHMGRHGRVRYERDFKVETMAGAVLSLYREHSRPTSGDRELHLQTTGTAI
ncbi:MAG: glycosyltransferase family 4 protein [Acidobacteriota bacterium]|nr:glycosyltransferase family 4 protein [Acidobacteriota bacterium]MDQ2843251.1 glycosyltransferase family 4 protein [Acidobacteriota bacterium]